MTDTPDDMEILVAEVRKTISDNKQFLAKLLDETDENDENDPESDDAIVAPDEEFEEL